MKVDLDDEKESIGLAKRNINTHKYKTIKEIVDQLKYCKFIDNNGHPLELNTAFCRLKEISELNYQQKFNLNEKVIYKDEEYFIRSIMIVSSSSPYTEVEYDLSKLQNHESTTNKTDISKVNENCLCLLMSMKNIK